MQYYDTRFKPTIRDLDMLRGRWREHPRYQGCEGHWLFNEGVGIAAHDTMNSNNGSLAGGQTWGLSPVGYILNFNGSSDVVTIQNESNFDFLTNSAEKYSILIWYYSTNAANEQRMVTKMNALASGGMQFNFDAANQRLVYTTGNSSSAFISIVTTTGTVPINRWNFAALTYNGAGWTSVSNFKLFRDSVENTVLFNLESTPTTINIADPVRIGSRGSGNFFSGMISHVLIYRRELSNREILDFFYFPFQIIPILDNDSVFFYQSVSGNYSSIVYYMNLILG